MLCHHPLDQFVHRGEIGNGPKFIEIVRYQVGTFSGGSYDSFFHLVGGGVKPPLQTMYSQCLFYCNLVGHFK